MTRLQSTTAEVPMAEIPISGYARMWPRSLFNVKDGKRSLARSVPALERPGVYVLYCGDKPYYVGKASKLRRRLVAHANKPGGKYYNFWDFFSVFVVENARFRNQLEGALIAAIPTANGAKPKIKKAVLPAPIKKQLHMMAQPPMQVRTKAAGG
jgi:hypothetical protein